MGLGLGLGLGLAFDAWLAFWIEQFVSLDEAGTVAVPLLPHPVVGVGGRSVQRAVIHGCARQARGGTEVELKSLPASLEGAKARAGWGAPPVGRVRRVVRPCPHA